MGVNHVMPPPPTNNLSKSSHRFPRPSVQIELRSLSEVLSSQETHIYETLTISDYGAIGIGAALRGCSNISRS